MNLKKTGERAGQPSERRDQAPAGLRRAAGATRALLAFAGLALMAFAPPAPPPYSIEAIRYATVPQFPLSRLVMGAPEGEKIDIAMVVWLIRGGGKTILFDTASTVRNG